ncbi:hypothetical protein D3C77_723600 [compost metagenome]
MLGVVECVRGGLVDRHGHRLGGRVGAVTGVDGEGFGFHADDPLGWGKVRSIGNRLKRVNGSTQ